MAQVLSFVEADWRRCQADHLRQLMVQVMPNLLPQLPVAGYVDVEAMADAGAQSIVPELAPYCFAKWINALDTASNGSNPVFIRCESESSEGTSLAIQEPVQFLSEDHLIALTPGTGNQRVAYRTKSQIQVAGMTFPAGTMVADIVTVSSLWSRCDRQANIQARVRKATSFWSMCIADLRKRCARTSRNAKGASIPYTQSKTGRSALGLGGCEGALL
jgi:hypothetical protein